MSKFIFFFLCIFSTNLICQIKFVPLNGCYLGAFIINDNIVKGDIQKFEQLTGKKHSAYLNYSSYGSPFPKSWIEDCRKNNSAAQIGFEPMQGLEAVTDSNYLRSWAKEAYKCGVPIFLRWASEMNIYNDNPWAEGKPTLYKEKFRFVAKIMKEEAPNVIMVWAPNWSPNVIGDSTRSIDQFYPGDDFVDWVGVDFYNWGQYYPYEQYIDPRDKLRYVCNKYSSTPYNKPIIICEWAVSHFDYWINPPKDIYQYCIEGMDKIYSNLQNEFPNVKAVFWFDYDSHSTNKSNFQLTDDIRILNNYKNRISENYFLPNIENNLPKITVDELADSMIIIKSTSFDVKVSSDYPIISVSFILNDKILDTKTQAPYHFIINPEIYQDGEYEVKLLAKVNDQLYNFKKIIINIDNNGDYYNLIIDNTDSNFSYQGSWWSSTSQPDMYGNDYFVSASGNGSNKAKWSFSIPGPGEYNIYAWWSEHTNRASNAPFTVSGGILDTTIVVNQKINGGKWNFLGKINFREKKGSVSLSNNADGYLVADAIRIYRNFSLLNNIVEFPKQNLRTFCLEQNYPNPFNSSTKIEFDLLSSGYTQLSVFNSSGLEVKSLINKFLEKGTYSVNFDMKYLSSGTYFYSLKQNGFNKTKSMTLLK